jgi:tetratricopeptide (TPR) repeat protein
MRGRFGQARSLHDRAAARWNDLVGHEHAAIWDARYRIERLAGDLDAAERAVRHACELLEESGERPYRSTLTGELARALCALGRFAEAEDSSRLSEELGTEDDVDTQMLWRQARATALARRGELAQAGRLAREALALAEQSDDLNANGDALVDLADVLELSDQPPEAAAALKQACALYARKGNVVMAERVQERLSADAEVSRR